MSSFDPNSGIGLAVGLVVFLFLLYIFLESRESDGNGGRHFSPQKLGKVLKKTFSVCLPDMILLKCASILIFCGFVGNSCMENIHSDEDIRESKKMARLAATLSRSKSKSSRKKSKHRRHGNNGEGDTEALFSGDNDSDLSDMESNSVNSDHSGKRSKSKSKSKSRHSRSDINLSQQDDQDIDSSGARLTLPDRFTAGELDQSQSYNSLTHSRPKGERMNLSMHSLPNDGRLSKSERNDNRLNLSQHSNGSKSSYVSRESLQALIAAEDHALGYKQANI